MRDRCLVLMYHRVLPADRIPESPSHPGIIVSTETFEMHLECVRKRFRALSPEAFATCMESGDELPGMSCLVTFDDGWRDNLEFALPILEKLFPLCRSLGDDAQNPRFIETIRKTGYRLFRQ